MVIQNFKFLKKNCDKKIIRKFKDMASCYKFKINNNPLIYSVYIKDFGGFEVGLTVIESGIINNEFFMTKGHRHKKKRDELYILIEGKGKLIIQDKSPKIVSLKKGEIEIIPGKSGHRLVNTGNKKLEVLTIYSKDSGHDYNFKFKKRIMRK